MCKKAAEVPTAVGNRWIVTEAGFYERYKPIRNNLRKYTVSSILAVCAEKINSFNTDDLNGLMALPWLWIVVLKWALMDPGRLIGKQREMLPNDLKALEMLVVKLSNYSRLPDEYEPTELYSRAMIYQQYTYQRFVSLKGIMRQREMFSRAKGNDYFKTEFSSKYGLGLDTFLKLSAFLVAILEARKIYKFHVHDLPVSKFRFDDVENFLTAISIDVALVGSQFREFSTSCRRPAEFLEQTPFLNFPIIKCGLEYWCVSRKVLSKSLDYFVYDALKRTTKFPIRFGRRFETYVGDVIRRSKLPFRTEDDLKKVLGTQSKLVDFLIHSGGENIFVDAKGVELADRAKFTHLSDVLKGSIKSSLLKAVEQGQEVKINLDSTNDCSWGIRSQARNFLFVVTYKSLCIGNALFLDHLIRGEVARSLSSYSECSRIPLENIYFFSIDEFESLMHLVGSGKITINEAMVRAKEADSNLETEKYYFAAHLSTWPEYHELGGAFDEQAEDFLSEYAQ
ncbi:MULTISPECIES: hypothetical protein [unclassified Pseudomonas]|uniref:GapS1 family protein n=1 Tax=unclassified Pseudomonas TaxID=196821 RepID=UPI000487A4BE|nr:MULTISPECIES: hypothetical protein [unclassified Pseudomonas]SMF40870.1 hypothetical protein SAMN05660912_03316 [Pseudomonas sp. LAMO17WK12:I1]